VMSDELLDDTELVDTPSDPFNRLVLNPGPSDKEELNPLCPKCEEPIRPFANQHQRVFKCGCDETRRFSFKRVGDDDE